MFALFLTIVIMKRYELCCCCCWVLDHRRSSYVITAYYFVFEMQWSLLLCERATKNFRIAYLIFCLTGARKTGHFFKDDDANNQRRTFSSSFATTVSKVPSPLGRCLFAADGMSLTKHKAKK